MKEETRAEKIARLQREIAAAQSELKYLILGSAEAGYNDSIKKILAAEGAQQTTTDLGEFAEPYCEKCFGPCLRRPRHGEFNICED